MLARLGLCVLCAGAAPGAGCAGREVREAIAARVAEEAAQRELVEFLAGEGVRADRALRVVEFDGMVAVDCHDPETPDVYLEVVCCTPDTREHESLVVAAAAPSLVHAALLLIGAEPGAPGGWRREGDEILPVPPRGEAVRVTLVTRAGEGTEVEHDPAAWIRQAGTGRSLREAMPTSAWVFAGSRVREHRGREVYDADGTGQLIGLHTFGSETIAWTEVESPEARIDDPQWLADGAVVPAIGTPVTVRLRLVSRGPSAEESERQ